MALEFRLPDVGEGTDSAEIVEWHVAVGDEVREDQPLVDIETDKAVVGIPCPTTGSVLELCANEGDTVDIGAVLAVFAPTSETTADVDAAVPVPAEAAVPPAAIAPDVPARPPAEPSSPAARREALERGVELSGVSGSGPFGAVRPGDIGPTGIAHAGAGTRADERRPLRGTRRTIARTLTTQWQTVPHVTDYREADASALLDLRRRLREDARAHGEEELAAAITATPILVKLAAVLLRRHPLLNAMIDMDREEILVYGSVNIGIATATPDGLLVPVIHGADGKTVTEIALEGAALGRAARERSLEPGELAGATFTLNNYGALGIWLGTPIVPPGQAANLGVGRIEERAVVRGGEITARPIVALACSGDHRLLDGDVIARFVSDLVRAIEDPLVLFGELR